MLATSTPKRSTYPNILRGSCHVLCPLCVSTEFFVLIEQGFEKQMEFYYRLEFRRNKRAFVNLLACVHEIDFQSKKKKSNYLSVGIKKCSSKVCNHIHKKYSDEQNLI